MPNVVEDAAILVGGVVGAGFLSGQESLQFFVSRNGPLWLALVLGIGVLSVGIWFGLENARRTGSRNSLALVRHLLGTKAGTALDAGLAFLVLGSVGVMLAGGGALGQLMLDWPNWCGTLAMALGICAVCATSPQMLFTLNTWIVAGLMVAAFATVVSLWSAPPAGITSAAAPLAVPSLVPASWHGAAVVYATGNVVLTIPLMASMGRRLAQRRHTAVVTAVTGGCLLLLALVIAATLARHAPFASHLPMLELAARRSDALGGLYAMGLWLAILSTGVSSAYALIERLRENIHVSRVALSALVVLAALPIGGFGFAQLIGIVYPLIGYLGCALLVAFAIRLPRAG